MSKSLRVKTSYFRNVLIDFSIEWFDRYINIVGFFLKKYLIVCCSLSFRSLNGSVGPNTT